LPWVVPWLLFYVPGDVISFDHVIPRGDWFEFVSCPHYFAEILIYLSFLMIGGLAHVTLLSLVLFVVTNQLVSGHLTHSWYRNHFGSSYPAARKAVIPFVM
jgi:3-oxo-5-alpha-steroid 4-dehydrogenase 3 / polyprenol reductase